MPAIHPARLQHQAQELAAHCHNPSAFTLEWRHLLEYYSQRTHRPGAKKDKPTAVQRYRISPPVFQAVLAAIEAPIRQDPDKAIPLLQALWEQRILESRLLAAQALGLLPVDRPELVTTLAAEWGRRTREDAVREAVISQGMRRLRREAPLEHFALLEQWFSGDDPADHILGLTAVALLLEETSYEDLPALYRFMRSILPKLTNSLRPYALRALRAIITRSPRESALFLERLLEEYEAPPLLWLARHSLDAFPPDVQTRLRRKIQNLRLD